MNRRYSGRAASAYAPLKWLYGESFPGHNKLRMLAEGPRCSTEWLRFGDTASSDMNREIAAITALDHELMRAIAALTEPHQVVICDSLQALERAGRP